MSVPKLCTAASICGKPCKWFRTFTTSTITARARPIRTRSLVAPVVQTEGILLAVKTGGAGRITARTPLSSTTHILHPWCRKGLGFRRHECFSVSSQNSSSPEGKEAVADMGSDDYSGAPRCSPLTQRQSQHQHQQQQQQGESSNLLTLPTLLTLGRVAAVPLLVCTFYMDYWWGTTATTVIFIAASITDWLDGYLARKMKLRSTFGAFLDPVADKLMVAATLVLLCTKPFEVTMFGEVPWLLTVPSIAIIGREITMSAVREWAASQNSKLLEAVAVNNLGKWKTATQMIALTILLATRDSSLGGLGSLAASGVVLLYMSAGFAVMSLVVYMKKIWRVLLK